jgi:(p)ppGpp synthase/HD superfamily hydrolase
MSDLISRAKAYAALAHKRIDQRRKYSNQPYQVHLEAVASIVATVSDDEEMIDSIYQIGIIQKNFSTKTIISGT